MTTKGFTLFKFRPSEIHELTKIQHINPATIMLAIIFGAVIALSACYGPRTVTVDLIGEEFRFTPDTIRVQEGDTVKINFTNPDVVPHLIDLPAFDQHIALPPDGYFTLEFVADKVGSFPYVCSVPGHQEAGMVGMLIVSPSP